MVPKGKDGNVEITIKLDGYNQSVLERNGVKQPVSIAVIGIAPIILSTEYFLYAKYKKYLYKAV